MSELAAILMIAGLQSACLLSALVMLYRYCPATAVDFEEELRRIDQYLREHEPEIDRCIAQMEQYISEHGAEIDRFIAQIDHAMQ